MSLIEVPKPEGNYIILEGISREKKVSKGLYIIHNLFTDEDSAKLVRKKEKVLLTLLYITPIFLHFLNSAKKYI